MDGVAGRRRRAVFRHNSVTSTLASSPAGAGPIAGRFSGRGRRRRRDAFQRGRGTPPRGRRRRHRAAEAPYRAFRSRPAPWEGPRRWARTFWPRRARDGARRWRLRRRDRAAHPLRVALRDASSSACNTSSCLRGRGSACGLAARTSSSAARGVERPRLHQMSDDERRRSRDTAAQCTSTLPGAASRR